MYRGRDFNAMGGVPIFGVLFLFSPYCPMMVFHLTSSGFIIKRDNRNSTEVVRVNRDRLLPLLGAILLLASSLAACGAGQERQQVYDFLTTQYQPILEEINGLMVRYNEITQIPPAEAFLREEELLSELSDLKHDTETIKLKLVGASAPPPCRKVRDKMIQLLELMYQAEENSIAFFLDYDTADLSAANELSNQANELATEIVDDVYDICQEYSIETEYHWPR